MEDEKKPPTWTASHFQEVAVVVGLRGVASALGHDHRAVVVGLTIGGDSVAGTQVEAGLSRVRTLLASQNLKLCKEGELLL